MSDYWESHPQFKSFCDLRCDPADAPSAKERAPLLIRVDYLIVQVYWQVDRGIEPLQLEPFPSIGRTKSLHGGKR
ncbi:hypothetical protein [Hyella patelloides]|uniref:hypothetical protein n=1 Tax=Hyella patelloides TaxID=1982969 RepID=UPI0011A3BF62|nr:hypothetical protein [Hyella patelloides]